MKKILVASDGSENSKRAIVRAKDHAGYLDGKITILTIVEPFVQYEVVGYEPIPVDDLSEKDGKAILRDSLKSLGDFKGQVDTKLRKGNPADEILKEAKEGEYDLIIIGSRGLGTFSKTILGSVSNKVLHHAKTNVLVVK